MHASTPPCTPWSLFSSKSAVCGTSTPAWVAMLVVTHQAVSACHRPVTRPNGYGIVTGEIFVTRPRPRDPRTREPTWVSIPVSITRASASHAPPGPSAPSKRSNVVTTTSKHARNKAYDQGKHLEGV